MASSRKLFEGTLEHFIPACARARDGGTNDDVRYQADALKLSAVSVADVVSGKPDGDGARQHEVRHAAVGAGCLAADELGVAGRFQNQPCMLGLAQRPFID